MNFETIINWLENKVNYCLSELSQRLGVDWIVEQGTSGIWTYRKWNSGIAECWTSAWQIDTAGSVSSLMGGYYGKVIADLPFTFVTVGNISGNGCTGTGLGWVYCGVDSTNNATQVNIYVCGNQNSTAIKYRCHVTGTWK